MTNVRRLAAVSALCLLGCTQRSEQVTEEARDGGMMTEFIAFAGDFRGFRSWQHFDVYDDAGVGDPAHPDHYLTEYRNRPDPTGNEPYSQGTLIVKEGTTGDPATRQFFAMAKRGGDYNALGALGWEWFELQNLADPADGVRILWRGYGPPEGEIYGGDARAGCNDCHAQASHDFVFGVQPPP